MAVIKEQLIEAIKLINEYNDITDKASKLGLISYESRFCDITYIMFDRLIESYFTIEGQDWVSWWLYERGHDNNCKAWDEFGNVIPTNTLDDLWEIVKQYTK